jgi:hypothetical protein
MKSKNQAFKIQQGTPKPVMQQISSKLSVSSNIYEVIREGILVGFTNRFISQHLQISSYVVEVCRTNLVDQGLIKKSSYGSRINAYKPVTLYATNHKGQEVQVPNFFSKFWNVGPSNTTVNPESFQLPKVTDKDFLDYKGNHVSKYLFNEFNPLEAIIDTILPEEVQTPDLVTIVPVNGPIDTKTDFIRSEQETTMQVARKSTTELTQLSELSELELFTVPEITPKEETVYDVLEVTPDAIVLTPKKTKMPTKSAICAIPEVPKAETTQEPVVVTLKGIKFILNVKTTEVIISDSSIEIK